MYNCNDADLQGLADFFRAGVQIVADPHKSMIEGRNHLGLDLASHKLPGSWPMR